MQVNTLMLLKKEPKMWELFKYNTYWIKDLNHAIDNIDLISNVLSSLK